MRQTGSRTIKVNKQELIDKIKDNKENHIKEYKQAVIDYKKEASLQLLDLKKKLNKGEMDLYMSITTPVDSSENYDKIALMFEMDVDDIVELSQGEFNEYIHDETSFAIQARLSNSTYSGKF